MRCDKFVSMRWRWRDCPWGIESSFSDESTAMSAIDFTIGNFVFKSSSSTVWISKVHTISSRYNKFWLSSIYWRCTKGETYFSGSSSVLNANQLFPGNSTWKQNTRSIFRELPFQKLIAILNIIIFVFIFQLINVCVT